MQKCSETRPIKLSNSFFPAWIWFFLLFHLVSFALERAAKVGKELNHFFLQSFRKLFNVIVFFLNKRSD